MVQSFILLLQVAQVLFLWIHDWIPLGQLNDVDAVRRQDPTKRLIIVTLVQSLPFTVLCMMSSAYVGREFPRWLTLALSVSYGALLIGQLRAWWLPYLLVPEPHRAARYRAMFGKTHSFLPERNGLVPNTAHVLLHACTISTLILLFIA